MHTLVDSESRALDELLSAVLKVTHMRTDAAVNSLCREVSGGATRCGSNIPWRARSLRLAKPLPHVLHGYALGAGGWDWPGPGIPGPGRPGPGDMPGGGVLCPMLGGRDGRLGPILALGTWASWAPMAVGDG